MKDFLIFGVSLCLFFACKTHDDSSITPAEVNSTVKFRDELLSEYDINLNRVDSSDNYNWDWTEEAWNVFYLNPEGKIVERKGFGNPFYSGSTKYGSLTPSMADIFPKDGWTLIKRDFGTQSSAGVNPYAIFYHESRGLLRICILRTNYNLQSFSSVSLSFKNNSYAGSYTASPGVFQWMVTQFDVSKVDKNFIKPSNINLKVREYTRYIYN